MRLRNSDHWYGLGSQLIHWVMAGLIIWMFFLGWNMTDIPDEDFLNKISAFHFHESLGLTILCLAVLRLIWRLTNPAPGLPDGMSRIEIILAKATHHGIYLLIFLIPISGWISTAQSPLPTISFFGLTDLSIAPFGEAVGKAAGTAHEFAGNLLLVFLALHVVGALKHHFVSRDTVLKRMILPAKD